MPPIIERELEAFDERESPNLADLAKTTVSRTTTWPRRPHWPPVHLRQLVGSNRFPARHVRIGVIVVAFLALFYLGYRASQVPLRIIRASSDAASTTRSTPGRSPSTASVN